MRGEMETEEEMERIIIIVPAVRPQSQPATEMAHAETVMKMADYDFGCYLA